MLSASATLSPVDPVARWLSACRCVRGQWSVRLELRGTPHERDDLDLSRAEQQRLLAQWACRDRVGPFERLGLAPTDDEAAIRRAWHDTCRRLHPDRHYGKRVGPFAEIMVELFELARAAYSELTDPRRRAQHLATNREAAP
jgi:hypothetical protein